jgi:hypothetical protein
MVAECAAGHLGRETWLGMEEMGGAMDLEAYCVTVMTEKHKKEELFRAKCVLVGCLSPFERCHSLHERRLIMEHTPLYDVHWAIR